jgi:hypothetical protein
LRSYDVHDVFQATEGWQTKFFNDGLHFTPEGSQAVWGMIQAKLAAEFPHLS